MTAAFLAGDLEPLWNRMTLDMRDAAGGSIREFRSFREKVAELAGEEVEVLDEEVLREQEVDIYRRLSVFTFEGECRASEFVRADGLAPE